MTDAQTLGSMSQGLFKEKEKTGAMAKAKGCEALGRAAPRTGLFRLPLSPHRPGLPRVASGLIRSLILRDATVDRLAATSCHASRTLLASFPPRSPS